MCEFTGWVNLEEDLTREKKIIENMLHAVGKTATVHLVEHVSKNSLMGFISLKGVDCEEQVRSQPITKSLGNNKFTIACVEQLENSKEVVAQLRKMGMDCKGSSDAEIILTAYMAWGQEIVKHIKGIYIFAIWDESRKTLLLVRDPSGEKHLFYAFKSDSIIFASEVKMLLAHPLLDPKAAHELTAGIPSEIKELGPGQCLVYDRQGIRIK